MNPADEQKLVISAISLIPYVLATALLMIPLYVVQKKALLGASWKDALLWLGGLVVYYGLSVGFMYMPELQEIVDDIDLTHAP